MLTMKTDKRGRKPLRIPSKSCVHASISMLLMLPVRAATSRLITQTCLMQELDLDKLDLDTDLNEKR
jgi:hypothetical protein